MSKVKVDQDLCIGCGTCVALCSNVFKLNDEGKAVVKKDADYEGCDIEDMIDSCPVEVISKVE